MQNSIFLYEYSQKKEISYEQFLLDLASNDIVDSTRYAHVLNLFRSLVKYGEYQFYEQQEPCEAIDKIDYDSLKARILEGSIILKTSGTTGKPKTVVQSVASLYSRISKSPINYSKSWLLTYSLYHMAGLQVVLQAFFTRSSLSIVESLSLVPIVLIDNKIEYISMTPTYFRSLLPYLHPTTTVQSVTFGGEILDDHTYERAKEIFPNAMLRNIYASTEAGTILKSDSTLFKIPDQLKGKIRFSEKNELMLYRDLLGKFSELDNDWFYTGDIVEFFGEFEFKFISRISDFINVGGYKVNPSHVEAIIRKYPGVEDVRCYGKKSSLVGEVVTIDIKMVAQKEVNRSDFLDWCREHLKTWEVPRVVKFIDDMDMTVSNKLIRKKDD